MRDNPYRSALYFRDALVLVESILPRPESYFIIKSNLKSVKAMLDKKILETWGRYNNARKNQETTQAAEELNRIVILVPDARHLDHQRALIYRDELKKLVNK